MALFKVITKVVQFFDNTFDTTFTGDEITYFTTTPEKYFGRFWEYRERQAKRSKVKKNGCYIRVQFRKHQYIKDGLHNCLELSPNSLEADFRREPNGDLNIKHVRKFWGIEKCRFIDTYRMEEFETGDPNRLSAVGVALLSQNDGFLTMIEYENVCTETRKNQRAKFQFWFDEYNGSALKNSISIKACPITAMVYVLSTFGFSVVSLVIILMLSYILGLLLGWKV